MTDIAKQNKRKTMRWIIIASFIVVTAVAAGVLIWYFTKDDNSEIKKNLKSIEVVTPPNRIEFTEGEYWDFLGLSIKANYLDAESEIVNDWDWDNKELLKVEDTKIIISYTLSNITKTAILDITVSEQPDFDPVIERAKNIFKNLPEIVTEDNLNYVKYCIELYDGLTDEQKENLSYNEEFFEALREHVRQLEEEISKKEPPPPKVYEITYAVFNGFPFTDIDYNGLDITYTEGGAAIILTEPASGIAAQQGYEFKYWTDGYNNKVTEIVNLKSNMTYYAVFELTKTVALKVVNYDNDNIYLNKPIDRNGYISVWDLNIQNIVPEGYLVIDFYLDDARILEFNTMNGAEIILRAVVVKYRNVEISTEADDVVSNWEYVYVDDKGTDILIESGFLVAKTFRVPIGASFIVTASGLNIDKIFIENVEDPIGIRNGTNPASASFEVAEGEGSVKIIFGRILEEIVSITFIGISERSYPQLINWNGKLTDADLYDIGVVFGEDSTQYINFYRIGNVELLFSELKEYQFTGNTAVIVIRKVNRFSVTINYNGGSVIVGGLIGKQSLAEALIGMTGKNIENLNYILNNAELINTTKQEVLNTYLVQDIVIDSSFEGFPEPTTDDLYGRADYTGQKFVGAWNALFNREDGTYESVLTLNAGGTLEYINKLNGVIVSQFSAIYRIENGNLVIKELTLENSDFKTLIGRNELIIDILFASDGLIAAPFYEITGTQYIKFNITLIKGAVRPVNYTGQSFTGTYTKTDIQGNITQIMKIVLLENGTTIITAKILIDGIQTEEIISSGYYRLRNGSIYSYTNSIIGTINLNEIINTAVKE